MANTDRRVQRTRKLLQDAMIELVSARAYDTITIQDIVERANIGRTTFYLHFGNKDELFISCHESFAGASRPTSLQLPQLSREQLLSKDVPSGLISAYRHLKTVRTQLVPIFQGKESGQILRQIRERSSQEIEANLNTCFANAESVVPLEVLANYLAGAQLALLHWWLEKRRPHTPETMAQTFHRLQRAAIRDAFQIE